MGVGVSFIAPGTPGIYVQEAELAQAAKFAVVGSASVLFYDWLVSLEEDAELVWTMKPSLFKFLALLTRYSGLANGIMTLMAFVGPFTSGSRACAVFAVATVATVSFGIVSGACVLGLRAVAIYAYRREICVLVGSLLLIEAVAISYATSTFVGLTLPINTPGCLAVPAVGHEWAIFVYLGSNTLVDLVLFILTTTKTWRMWRQADGRSSLAEILLRDGIMFYGLILIINVATMICFYIPGSRWGPVIAPFSTVCSSCLTCHLVLNLASLGRSLNRAQDLSVSASRLATQPSTRKSFTVEEILRQEVEQKEQNQGSRHGRKMRGKSKKAKGDKRGRKASRTSTEMTSTSGRDRQSTGPEMRSLDTGITMEVLNRVECGD